MTVYVPVIGLEVHAELLTRSKMFCGCAVVDLTQAEPNSSVCEICTGMPGTLPVINRRAVEFATRVALALHCEIAETSVFARKNYFYPDLPKGYQISQYELPLAQDGWLAIELEETEKRIGIRRVHLEEDTGKMLHRDGYSLIDYNRSGVPLLEIVSEPELQSVDEVKAYARGLRSILRYLRVSSGDMEKGVIRFEANVSVRKADAPEMGTRTEIKNLNSFRSMVRALEFEIERQSSTLDSGGKVKLETVGWDEVNGVTVPQRGKEEAHDYRYFPEPDLPPLVIAPEWIEELATALPELPNAKKARFIEHYGLSPYAAGMLTADRDVAEYFENAATANDDIPPDKIANWITGELFSLLNQAGIEISRTEVSPAALAELVGLVERGLINQASAKTTLGVIFDEGGSPLAIIERDGLMQLSDADEITKLVKKVLQENPEQVQSYLEGKTPIFEWLFGQVMLAAGGKAKPATVRTVLESHLERPSSP
jgi:aspartyl-tRNA(Asn)/glutamyl-tRNA(Gln) amidotransferase subunit B